MKVAIPQSHPRERERLEITADLVRGDGIPVHIVESRGETRIERIMSLVLLGDLVSLYLAVLAGVDPTPVPAIDALKGALNRS